MRRVLLLVLGLGVPLGFAALVFAYHQSGITTLATRDRRECSGAHCMFIATWIKLMPGNKYHTLAGTLSMDTLLVGAGARNSQGATPPFLGGDSFSIPIDASGEFTGYAASLYDSPPITFLPNGKVHVETGGIGGCEIEKKLLDPTEITCKPLAEIPDVEGEWSDAVRVLLPTSSGAYTIPTQAVSCTPTSAGTSLSCTSTTGFTGRVMVELRRTVDNFLWNGVGVVARNPPAAYQKKGKFVGKDPFPGTMISSAFVDFSPDALNLTVESPQIAPTAPLAGDTVTFTAAVRNIGAQPAGASETRLRLDLGSDGTWDLTLPLMPTGSLAQGAHETETWLNAWVASPGTHRYEICADARNAVPEASEADNCALRVLHAASPPAVSVALPPSVLPGDPYRASGTATDGDHDMTTRVWHRAAADCPMDPPPAPVPACATTLVESGPVPNASAFTEELLATAAGTGTECVRLTVTDAREFVGAGQACTAVGQVLEPSPTPRGVLPPPAFREVPPGEP